MPLTLVPPKAGRSPYWYIRGTYLGQYVERSAGTSRREVAAKALRKIERDIERGAFSGADAVTFAAAATAYMRAGGERRFMTPLIKHFGTLRLADINQPAIDGAAFALYPDATVATRNRQVYSPVSAVLKRAGIETKVKRPKGWRGNKRTFWLQPEATFRLLDAAAAIDAEFGILCTVLNYTGLRLDEALTGLTCERIELQREFAYIPDTKTGEPRACYLPPMVVTAIANHPRGLDRAARLFRFHDGGHLRDMLRDACRAAGITLPHRTAFHVFRHNYGTWMRLYGGLDSLGLTRTGVWADEDSVARYSHSEPTAEARQAAKLPTPNSVKTG